MTRGFITIATGSEYYATLAHNLLTSYRHFSSNALPFAIITDKDNKYTSEFDDVILLKDSTHSFLDKFELFSICPYDETIFLDADSLAYGDLNELFEVFQDATDFSGFGINVYPPYQEDDGTWYRIEDIGKYGHNLPYKSRIHAGVLFFRRYGGVFNGLKE